MGIFMGYISLLCFILLAGKYDKSATNSGLVKEKAYENT